jgi:hypothetical protein
VGTNIDAHNRRETTIYVRRIKSGEDGAYFQLVESYRDEGTVKKRVLVHLGQHETVEEVLNEWPEEIAFLRRFKRYGQANKLQDKLDRLQELMEGRDIRRS